MASRSNSKKSKPPRQASSKSKIQSDHTSAKKVADHVLEDKSISCPGAMLMKALGGVSLFLTATVFYHVAYGAHDNLHSHTLERVAKDSSDTIHQSSMDADSAKIFSVDATTSAATTAMGSEETDRASTTSKKNPALDNFNFVCQDPASICHPSLKVVDRAIVTADPIQPGEVLFRIPRKFQLKDLDAFRDGTIQQLFSARHLEMDSAGQAKGLGNGAFVAMYLALYQHDPIKRRQNPLLDQMYQNMPHDWSFHPIFWTEDQLKQRLPRHSVTYKEVTNNRMLINKEYRAFVRANPELLQQHNIDPMIYRAMRLVVSTRGYGQATYANSDHRPDISLRDELTAYAQSMNNPQIQQKSLILILVADMFNSHPNPNVEYYPSPDGSNALVFQAKQTAAGTGLTSVSPGNSMELISTYDVDLESNLFARYGFVNGDGSMSTAASVAIFQSPNYGDGHEFDNVASKGNSQSSNALTPNQIHAQLQYAMMQYLRFDDGYEDCVSASTHSSTDLELKMTKFQALLSLAQQDSYWTITRPTLNPLASPVHPKHNPDQGKKMPSAALPRDLEESESQDVQSIPPNILLTCRIMSLTADDYGGNALTVLQNGNEFRANQGRPVSDDLHYRELRCLGRLFVLAIKGYTATEIEDEAMVASTTDGKHNTDWNLAHLRLGELRTLRAYHRFIRGALKDGKFSLVASRTTIRSKPCPKEKSMFLLETK